MTREEALKIINDLDARNKPLNKNEQNWLWLKRLEALGLLKFDEEKKSYPSITIQDVPSNNWRDKFGVIQLEEWPEGLVLWVGGEIVYKSWRNKDALIKAEQVLKDRNEGTMYAYDLLYNTLDSLIKYIKGAG